MMFTSVKKFGTAFMNVAKATANHAAFRAEVANSSKKDFALGFTKNIAIKTTGLMTLKTVLTADLNGLVNDETSSTILSHSRKALQINSSVNKAFGLIDLFKDVKNNISTGDLEKLAINGFSLSKMIFSKILPSAAMNLSLLNGAYSAGVNEAYRKYEQKQIGHLSITDLEISSDDMSSENQDNSANGFIDISTDQPLDVQLSGLESITE